jgi:hypothetical protein
MACFQHPAKEKQVVSPSFSLASTPILQFTPRRLPRGLHILQCLGHVMLRARAAVNGDTAELLDES